MIVEVSTSLDERRAVWLQVAFFAADKRIDERFKNVVWIWRPGNGWGR